MSAPKPAPAAPQGPRNACAYVLLFPLCAVTVAGTTGGSPSVIAWTTSLAAAVYAATLMWGRALPPSKDT